MAAYDAIVVGLGALGAAAADALGRRGRAVLGLDRFAPPHSRGSSHGRTRIIREAYFEAPHYVPLVRRAYELWDELARDAGRVLLRRTGALAIGPARGTLVAGARRSAAAHGIVHEELEGRQLRRRWPVLAPPAEAVGLYEARAGLLFPEECVEALLRRAAAAGAELRTGQAVTGWRAEGEGVEVVAGGERHRAGALVLAAGAWLPELLHGPPAPRLAVERQTVHWFAPARDGTALGAERCPVLLWEPEPERLFYVVPDTGHGVKAALHHEGEATAPDRVRPPDAADEAAVRELLQRLVPAANGALREASTCLYTNTDDRHFVLDRHPAHPQVLVASACSGHGFKFSVALGELLADLVAGTPGRLDLSPFSLARLERR